MDGITAQLNDAQARHAVRLFYDHLPPAAWDGGRKPAPERVSTVVAAVREEASPADQARLTALLDDGNPAAQAALARALLEQALFIPDLAPAAQEAVADAAKPNMGFDPMTGMLIIGMLLATTSVDRDADGALHVHLGAGAAGILSALKVPEILEKLPAVMKQLPESVLARLL